MKVLSVRQPWVELTLLGRKQYEIRTWKPSALGRIWLHVGQAYDRRNIELAGLSLESLVQGALVGTVEIVDVAPFTEEIAEEMRAKGAYFGVWSPGSYA